MKQKENPEAAGFSGHVAASLKKYRFLLGISYSEMERYGLGHIVAHNIEDGKNCSIDKVFLFLHILNQYASSKIVLTTVSKGALIIDSKEKLGTQLKELREGKNLSMMKMKQRSGILDQQVICIEKGEGYTLRTLDKYLIALDEIEDFDVILY